MNCLNLPEATKYDMTLTLELLLWSGYNGLCGMFFTIFIRQIKEDKSITAVLSQYTVSQRFSLCAQNSIVHIISRQMRHFGFIWYGRQYGV